MLKENLENYWANSRLYSTLKQAYERAADELAKNNNILNYHNLANRYLMAQLAYYRFLNSFSLDKSGI